MERGLTLSEIATRLHFSKQYLSQVELGSVRPNAYVIQAYARELNLDPHVLLPTDLGATNLLALARAGMSSSAPAPDTDFPGLSSDPIIEGPRNVIAQATAMLAAAARHPRPGAEVFLCLAHEEDIFRSLPEESVRQWELAIQHLLVANYDLVHIWQVGDDESGRHRMIRRIFTYLQLGNYRPRCLPPIPPTSPALDLLLVPGQGALLFVNAYESASVRAAFYFAPDGEHYQVLNHYVSSLQTRTSELLRVYPSQSLDFDFATLDAHSVDRHPGSQSVVKGGVSSVHIPGWVDAERLRRYLHARLATLDTISLSELRSEQETLLANRRLRTAYFLERARRWRVQQVTSREAVMRMLSTGEPPDDDLIIPFEESLRLTREESLACIRLLIERLDGLPNFELALLPTDIAATLDDGFLKTFWQVTGSDIAILESWRQRPDGTRQELDLAIYESHVVRALNDHFTSLWDAIPTEFRDRQSVIAQLHELAEAR